MRSFYINPATGDIDFDGSNNIKMVGGDDELIQSVRNRIATNVGEWFLNPDFGFDRFEVLGKKVDYDMAADILSAAILNEERIAGVDDLKFDYDAANRKMFISFSLTKTDGGTVEGGVTV